jgi:protein-disulfide isomerase
MKRRFSIVVIASVAIAAIIAVIAVGTHLRLSATEESEKGDETAQETANEVLTGKPSHPSDSSQWELSYQTLVAQGSPSRGSPQAKVTLIEFGDFQCEFCARFAKDTESQIDQNYVETGKINMVFKHLVHYGSTSDFAAQASQCANEQGKFWEYYHILYPNQNSFMLSQDSNASIKSLASKIDGLDVSKFNTCADSGKYGDIAKKDTQLATSLGLDNTPSFLIVKSDDGKVLQKLVGAYPFATFKTVLDKAISDGAGGD